MPNLKIEQRVNLKFLVKLKKSPTECLKMLSEVYGKDTMSRTRVFEWHKKFKDGREGVKDDEHPGRPCTSKSDENVDKIDKIVRNDRRLSIRMVADMINIDKETQFLANKRIPVLEHPPYSPDLAPSDFYLFPKIKTALKRTHFRFVEEVKTKAADLLKGLTSKELQHCFEQWRTRMEWCIVMGGEYIEGDHI
ncbi:Hypothetical protein CINCED_3A020937 [Cinara cedri]|uniref:Mos1 transposase HTH domain-containing protein n=1 Tax=Cinara cedri TaxID=506608 RepID=A0A5E4N4H5_9HEMI|nr:Hypothetical protein CINCED_3A020937 [Cinara cedri]